MTAQHDVPTLVADLRGDPMPLARAVAPAGMPDRPGLYAWWATPGALAGVAGPPHPTAIGRELLYVGISPGRAGSTATLRTRLLRNHLRRTRQSTMRRALAAFLWQDLRWTPVLTPDGKPALDPASEGALTAWMHQWLAVTWAEHPEPWVVERAVITALQPPLNVTGNAVHPRYRDVRAALNAFIAAARARGPARPRPS